MKLLIDEIWDADEFVMHILKQTMLPVLDYFGFNDVTVRDAVHLGCISKGDADNLADEDNLTNSIYIYIYPGVGLGVPAEFFTQVKAFDGSILCARYKNIVVVSRDMLPRLWELFAYGTETAWNRRGCVREDGYEEAPYTTDRLLEDLAEGYTKGVRDEVRRLEERLGDLKIRYRDAAATVVEIANMVEVTTKMHIAAQTALDTLDVSTQKERYKKELEELGKSPLLKRLAVEDKKLVFYTELITVYEGEGVTRPFGEYKVTLNLKTSELWISNLDNRKTRGSAIPHPHCDEDGKPCMGNLASVLPELVASTDLLGIWQVLLSFLSSYNKDDAWGARYTWWPAYLEDGSVVEDEGYKCELCGREVDYEDDMSTCDDCGQRICFSCRHETDDDGWVCNDCIDGRYCKNCDIVHIDRDMRTCEYCGIWVCEDSGDWLESQVGGSAVFVCCDECGYNYMYDHPEYDPDYEEEPDEDDYPHEDEFVRLTELEEVCMARGLDLEIEQAITGGA